MESGSHQETIANSHRRSLHAFTLIELMVVVGIILILIAVSVPAVRALTKSNSQKQAVNLLTSMVAHARALAIQSHGMTGVVIFESDATNTVNTMIASKSGGQSYAQIVVGSQTTGITNGGGGAVSLGSDGSNAQPLPKDVGVAALDDDPTSQVLVKMDTANITGNARLRLVVFDENGQLVIRRNMSAYPASSVDTTPYNNSSPGFLVFSLADLQSAIDRGAIPVLPQSPAIPTLAQQNARDAGIGNWIEQNADVLIFNTYTGNAIR